MPQRGPVYASLLVGALSVGALLAPGDWYFADLLDRLKALWAPPTQELAFLLPPSTIISLRWLDDEHIRVARSTCCTTSWWDRRAAIRDGVLYPEGPIALGTEETLVEVDLRDPDQPVAILGPNGARLEYQRCVHDEMAELRLACHLQEVSKEAREKSFDPHR